MRRWRTAAATAVIAASMAVALAMSPSAQSQPRTPRASDSGTRVLEVFGGGSRIGASVRDVGEEDGTRLKLATASGVLVEEVTRDSPAETAGLKPGDVVVEFDGERVRSTRHFTRLIQETPAGRKVQASVMRDGQRVALSIAPQASEAGRYIGGDFDRLPELARRWAMPAPPAPPAPPAAPGAPRAPLPPAPPAPPALRGFFEFDELVGRGSARLGVTVSDLQPQLAEYFAVRDGVLVTSVTSDSAAAKAGLKAGDVITTLNGATISSPGDLRQATATLNDGDELAVGITREKKAMTLKGKVEGTSQRRRTSTVL